VRAAQVAQVVLVLRLLLQALQLTMPVVVVDLEIALRVV
jgi:hypothetical protein